MCMGEATMTIRFRANPAPDPETLLVGTNVNLQFFQGLSGFVQTAWLRITDANGQLLMAAVSGDALDGPSFDVFAPLGASGIEVECRPDLLNCDAKAVPLMLRVANSDSEVVLDVSSHGLLAGTPTYDVWTGSLGRVVEGWCTETPEAWYNVLVIAR